MPLKARQRSRLAVLAVLALVGSLLAVSAVPAVAAGDEKMSAEAEFSACVAAATGDAGFTDMEGNFAADAANCLAHYGITVGTSEGVFSPSTSISRAQMALFMVRAATVAGVELDDPEDQGFDDIGNWTDAIQDGINQAAAAGIMSGDGNAFNPRGAVSRQDMAVILEAFLNVAEIDNLDDDGNVLDGDGVKVTVDTPFGDLGSVPFSAHNAINNLYELGVASGTGDGSTFTPGALMSRGQMAVFVTRALAHTNARPAGVSVQGDATADTDDGTASVVVSVRDESHAPVPDALVDVFSSTMPDEVLDDDGTCNDDVVEGDCEIASNDLATDPDGNTDVSVDVPESAGTVTVWAWTGEIGDTFDADETMAASHTIEVDPHATGTNLTDSVAEHATRVKFGETITYTLQVVDGNGDPVRVEGLAATILAQIQDTSRLATGDDGSGQLRPDDRTTMSEHKTDADGRIEVSFSQDDPDDADSSNDLVTLTLTVTAATTGGVPAIAFKAADSRAVASRTADTVEIVWSDEAAAPATLTLSQAVSYHETNDDGVRHTVTATLVDQYGDPVRGVKVDFWSTVENPVDGDSLGLGGAADGEAGSATSVADRRTTSRHGVATKSYSRSATAAGIESIDAQYIMVNGMCRDVLTDCDEETDTDDTTTDGAALGAEAITHYWATGPATGGETFTTLDVLVVDKDENTIILDQSNSPRKVTYKAGDQFRVGGDAVTMAEFEKELSADDLSTTSDEQDQVTAVIGDDEDDINTFDITTNNPTS